VELVVYLKKLIKLFFTINISTKMPHKNRILSKDSVKMMNDILMNTVNIHLKKHNSEWNLVYSKIKTYDRHICIEYSFCAFGSVWYSYVYTIDYNGNSIDSKRFGICSTVNHPLKNDFFVSFDFNTHFKDFLDTLVIESMRKKTAYIVSNKIKKSLIAAVWHPARVAKWMEAGVALEDL